jgi:ribonuclease R
MGYVLVDQLENDIMVRPSDLQTALHGDLVKVAIKERKSNGRMQGVVKEVIKRKRSEFIGQLQMGNGFAFFVAETDKPMPDIFIPKQLLQGAGQGDRVVAKVIKWADGDDKRPMGEVVTILKEEDMNDAAMKEILLEAGFPLSFSDEVIEESARLPEQISQDEIARRKDCRDILTFTIDPVDAKDFDDAISFRKLPSGWFEIGVHIADVSHYVEPQTALDAEA